MLKHTLSKSETEVLTKQDVGDIAVNVFRDPVAKRVILAFDKEVKWIRMTPAVALFICGQLTEAANECGADETQTAEERCNACGILLGEKRDSKPRVLCSYCDNPRKEPS